VKAPGEILLEKEEYGISLNKERKPSQEIDLNGECCWHHWYRDYPHEKRIPQKLLTK
jgi:hypothetical protein